MECHVSDRELVCVIGEHTQIICHIDYIYSAHVWPKMANGQMWRSHFIIFMIFINLAGDFSNDGSLEEACITCEPPDLLGDGWWCYISAKISIVIPLWSISKRATLKFLPFGESMIWCQNDAFKLWSPQVIKMSHGWQCVGSKFNGICHFFSPIY